MADLNSAQVPNNSNIQFDTLFNATASATKSATSSNKQLSSHRPLRQQNVTQSLLITHSKDWWSIISEYLLVGGSLLALGYMFKSLINQQKDPEENRKAIAEHVKTVLLKKLIKSGRKISNFNTNPYEDSLLDLIVLPNSIDVKFGDIGGLDHIKSDLTETVLVPLIYPQLTGSSRLCAPPLGVLFHGPPGTGKSMMAKAIARETNATFFNVDMSRLMSKWYGDSQKYISALFSLARKMAPSIIWIDEIDALFSQRSRSDHSADVYNKALFLSLWDGLASDIYNKSPTSPTTGETSQVIILGASNRPQQVDEAFLRRMSRQYEFTMPDKKTRKLILSIFLKTENVHKNVDLNDIAQKTQFYSGSDLKELCKYAATLPLREYVRKKAASKIKPKSKNYAENIILDGVYNTNTTATTPGFKIKNKNKLTKKNLNIINNKGKNKKILNMFENEKEGFILRPIEQNDLLTALKHIKSTMKAHDEHKRKYGSSNSLFNFNNLGLFGLNGNRNNFNNNANVSNDNTPTNTKNIDLNEDENDNDNDDVDDVDVE